MSLPPGFLDELRNRLSLSQVVGRKVVWDPRKSNQGKGDMWAPCPFHQEKTASFHVDDRKGYYYCFGCHAKGDAITFVRETENVGFMEAVEILAGEAGMPMPERDPQAKEKSDRRSLLADVMEQAVQFFRLQLQTGAGADARDYLDRRGLTRDAQDRWQIGFAPDGWRGLWDHLRGKGVAEDLILAAGLAKAPQKGSNPYDTFRNRIMFPIRDARGSAIAFGGRAMDPGDTAKYLNSPETELFDKSRSLFNHGPAREAAGKGQALIVAEGYMDVIALSEAGFGASVAPLGTAITENQLQMLWRIAPEPIIALDGDTAGLRAAMRLIDLALPLLEAGRSLRFALMPDGQDPDDLIRASGSKAIQKVLDDAIPMVQLLWQRETEGQSFDSPERKAALEKALEEKVRLIADRSIQTHYSRELRTLTWQLFNPRRMGGGWTKRQKPGIAPTSETRNSTLAQADDRMQAFLREAVVLASLIATPRVIPEFETGIERLTCDTPDHSALRDVILRVGLDTPDALADSILQELGAEPLENLHALRHVAISPCVRTPGDLDMARQTVSEELAKLEAQRGLDAEMSEATSDPAALEDEAVTWRLGQAAEAMTRATQSRNDDTTEYDKGDNGALINRKERNALDALLDQISFAKSKR